MENTQKSTNVRWEYTALTAIIEADDLFIAANKSGQQGWELVTAAYDDFLIFKRRLP